MISEVSVATPLKSATAMPAYFKIDKERRLVMSTAEGVLTMAEALAHQEKLLKDPDFDPSFSQLWDLSQVTNWELDAADMRRLAQRTLFSSHSRRACLTTRDLVFGHARMFEMLRESAGETGIRIFRNLDDALDWVLAKDSAD
jgi:hypothetical protein